MDIYEKIIDAADDYNRRVVEFRKNDVRMMFKIAFEHYISDMIAFYKEESGKHFRWDNKYKQNGFEVHKGAFDDRISLDIPKKET